MANPLPVNVDMTTVYLVASIVLTIVFVVGGTLLISILIIKKKRYGQFQCEIWEFNDEGQLIEVSKDRAGVFYDGNTKSRLLFLEKNKGVALNPDNIPVFYRGKERVIYLLKTGLKNFHYIRPKVKFDRVSLSVGEEDVNWAESAYERSIKTVTTGDRLTQILPYIIWALVIVGTLILMIKLLQKVDVIVDVLQLTKEIAMENAKATGTTVIQ